jgi:hypothetical protein
MSGSHPHDLLLYREYLKEATIYGRSKLLCVFCLVYEVHMDYYRLLEPCNLNSIIAYPFNRDSLFLYVCNILGIHCDDLRRTNLTI